LVFSARKTETPTHEERSLCAHVPPSTSIVALLFPSVTSLFGTSCFMAEFPCQSFPKVMLTFREASSASHHFSDFFPGYSSFSSPSLPSRWLVQIDPPFRPPRKPSIPTGVLHSPPIMNQPGFLRPLPLRPLRYLYRVVLRSRAMVFFFVLFRPPEIRSYF